MDSETKELVDRLIKATERWKDDIVSLTEKYNESIKELDLIRQELEVAKKKMESTNNARWYRLLIEYKPIVSFVVGVSVLALVLLGLDRFSESNIKLFRDNSGVEIVKP